jgi:uncharacterized protein with HEPN domain
VSRDVNLFLEDMQTACEKVVRYVKNLKQKQFFKDEMTYDAVVRNLTIIGEAVKNVPQEIRELHPGIEWRKIAGFRDIAVHDYFGIDEDILWDIIQNEIPYLLTQLNRIIIKEK